MSPTEKAIGNVNEKHDKAAADRRKMRGSLAVEAWKCLLVGGLNSDAWSDYDDLASSSFRAADAMLAKMEKEGAL